MKKDDRFSFLMIFIFGIIFFVGLLPMIESAVECFILFIEDKKGKLSKSISKTNKEIEELVGVEEINTNVIGFEIPSYNEEYCDCDDRFKQKVGF